MKTTIKELRKIIREEYENINESQFHHRGAEAESNNAELVLDVIMLGLKGYLPSDTRYEDMQEYSFDVRTILERNAKATEALADIIRELELSELPPEAADYD